MTDTSIARGEIWLVNFDPTVGQEIQKARPAVVISIGAAFRYSLQIVVPITTWQDKFAKDFWMIRLPPDSSNHLDNESAANAFQIRCVCPKIGSPKNLAWLRANRWTKLRRLWRIALV